MSKSKYITYSRSNSRVYIAYHRGMWVQIDCYYNNGNLTGQLEFTELIPKSLIKNIAKKL